MVDDIITALSHFKALFVIARNSSFTYKGRAVDVKQVGRELGVRYVLEGSVRKAANRVRITGQLVDTATGAHLWAERFDGGLGDIFDLQDQVTESVVGAIAPVVEKAEIERAKRKPMRFELSQAPTPGSVGQVSDLLLRLLLFATVAASGWPTLASEVGDDPKLVQQQPSHENGQPEENHESKQTKEPEPSAPSTTPGLCEALGAAAVANELPVDFFTRLIWQESHFKPNAISRKGAQGIAQFMPATARSSGLENPFNPLEAITKSGQLLRDLRLEFGNLGLAAAAYNAGSGRIHDWLGGRRPLPQETRAYVRVVTGRSVEEWAAGTQTNLVEMSSIEDVRCDLPVTALIPPNPEASQPKPETIKPWGVQIVGGPTREKALARYHEWQPKYAAIVAGREPHVVIRGIIGQMGAARVRVGEDTRAGAERLCAALRAAGTYCDVLRN